MATVLTSDTKFTTILPAVIDYAEQRMYRELQLLSTQIRDQTQQTAIGNRSFTFPQRFVIVDAINTISGSVRTPCMPASRDFIDFVYGSGVTTGQPAHYAMETDQTVSFAPTPDINYTVEVVGKVRPPPLADYNPTTFLTLYLPDAFLACSMIFYSGYQ